MLTIGWFSTGRDEAARQLLQVVQNEISKGNIEANIAFVFSNREPGESSESDLFFQLVNSYKIPLICFSSARFKTVQKAATSIEKGTLSQWRLEYDREIMQRLDRFKVDLCVLAGYMLIVGKEMCHKYDMINLHPAVPDGPKGSWQQVIWTLIQEKAKESGVMMHLVTPDLDRGPVITYCVFPITGEPFDKHWKAITNCSMNEIKKEEGEANSLFQLIRQHGLVREFPLIVSTLTAFSQGRVKIKNGKVLFDSQDKPISGYNLSYNVNKAIGIT